MSYTTTILGKSARARQLNAQILSLRGNRRGSIEGLPLYFLVSAVVVAVAMSALLSMMGGMQGQTLGSVDCDRDMVQVAGARATVPVNVTVMDTNGRPIEGATVTIEGLGVSMAKKTDTSGTARFNAAVDLGNANFGELHVEASFAGPVGEGHRSTTVLVTRA
jgi:hypothetical protein